VVFTIGFAMGGLALASYFQEERKKREHRKKWEDPF